MTILNNHNSLRAMNKVIVKGLATLLKPFVSFNLNDYFTKLRYDCPGISMDEQNRLKTIEAFYGQLELKRLVGELLQGSFTNWAVDEWIVHQWGGIRTFDISRHNRITEFRDHLATGSLIPLEFQRISSLSKIASFVSRDKYFIYDSRVAFSLNGLLLKMWQGNPNLPIRFFPLPSAQGGRDEMMRRMICQLCPTATYLSKEETYIEYNNLILNLSQEIKKDLPPCWIEMLLFVLGKTNGVIQGWFDFSRIKEEVKARLKKQNNANKRTKPAAKKNQKNQESKAIRLSNGTRLRGGRIVQSGFDILYKDRRFYWFIVNKKTFRYIELLTNKGSESLEGCDIIPLLENKGFNVRGKDYIYKRINQDNDREAESELEEIAKQMIDEKDASPSANPK